MVEPEKNASSSSAQTASQERSETSPQFGNQLSFEGQGTSALGSVQEWVRQNQMMAVIGAFALGTFIGVMMRD